MGVAPEDDVLRRMSGRAALVKALVERVFSL